MATAITQTTQTFNYINECPKDLECPICHEALIEPVVEPKCGHMFCTKCIHDWLSKNSSCPSCRVKVNKNSLGVVPIYIKNLINSLQVLCPNCKNTFERQKLSSHMLLCPIPCIYNCGQKISPVGKQVHEDKCPMKTIPCSAAQAGCKFSGIRSVVDEHMKKCARYELYPELMLAKSTAAKVSELSEIINNLIHIMKTPYGSAGYSSAGKKEAQKFIDDFAIGK